MAAVAPSDREIALSPSWLSEIMQTRHPGAEVSGVTVLDEFATLATKVRFALEYAKPVDGAPRSLFMKGFFGDDERRGWIGVPEARFYSELASMLEVRMPRALYAAVDETIPHGLVILYDLVAEGAQFLTALSPYTPDQVDATLAELAKLHAGSWDSPKLEADWVQPEVSKFTDWRPTEGLQELLDGERGIPLPAEVRDARRLRASVLQVFAVTQQERRCLVHGDAHAGNLYLDAEGRPGICDWQIVSCGHWSFDVAYHVATALEVADREKFEVELVRSYLERMRKRGIEMPSWGDAWEMYRRAFVYGYNLWAVTTSVDARIIHEFVKRLGTAVAAHESFQRLGV